MNDNFEVCKEEFDRYVRNFDLENERILSKYEHSLRVLEFARQLAIGEKQ